jgi:hypothetical protein
MTKGTRALGDQVRAVEDDGDGEAKTEQMPEDDRDVRGGDQMDPIPASTRSARPRKPRAKTPKLKS